MKRILYFLFITLLLTGCSASKQNITYLSDLSESNDGVLGVKYKPLTIQVDDELVINVSSEVPTATTVYNLPFNNTTYKEEIPLQNTQIKFQTYIVNSTGDIQFPILGKVHAAGMTTSGLAEYLKERIGETVENPIVRVELVNFKVQVTGDVKDPQTIKVSSERFTILDAIAAAGDFNVSGRRDNVLVIREEDGEVKYHRVDLSNSKALESPYYYLRQNDVIYVEPGQLKKDELTYSPRRTFNVSIASILVSSASVIASLVIAFAK